MNDFLAVYCVLSTTEEDSLSYVWSMNILSLKCCKFRGGGGNHPNNVFKRRFGGGGGKSIRTLSRIKQNYPSAPRFFFVYNTFVKSLYFSNNKAIFVWTQILYCNKYVLCECCKYLYTYQISRQLTDIRIFTNLKILLEFFIFVCFEKVVYNIGQFGCTANEFMTKSFRRMESMKLDWSP